MTQEAKEVVKFWLEAGPKKWFVKDENFDNEIREKFLSLYEKATKNELDSWMEEAESSLALVILLDQFSRNMFRGDKRSFEFDQKAVEVTKSTMEKGLDKEIKECRSFVYLPLMHSENLEDQNECVRIFKELSEEDEQFKSNYEYAVKHQVIIERFGRFPHRNEVMGRESTPEEKEFLKQPGSSF